MSVSVSIDKIVRRRRLGKGRETHPSMSISACLNDSGSFRFESRPPLEAKARETIKSSQHKITTVSAIEITVETEIRHSLAKVDDGDPVVLAEQDVLRSAVELGLR